MHCCIKPIAASDFRGKLTYNMPAGCVCDADKFVRDLISTAPHLRTKLLSSLRKRYFVT